MAFWTKFAQAGYFQSKIGKVNIAIKFYIFECVKVPNFGLNWQFWLFGPNLPKKGIFGKNRKSEHHHWILHIWISLGTISVFKSTFLISWTKSTQKGYFHHWILQNRISLGTNFSLSRQFCFFGTKLPKKDNSDQKQKNWTSPLNSVDSN